MKTKFWRGVAVAASLVVSATVAQSASAQEFKLNFGGGSANVQNQPGSGGANLLIDFLTPSTAMAIPFTNLPGIVTGNPVTMNDVVVNGNATGSCVSCPQTFLQVGGYTFTLTDTPSAAGAGSVVFGPIALNGGPTGTSATLFVSGTVNNFGPSATATFEGLLTGQFSGRETPTDIFNAINTGGTRNVSVSGEFTITVTPTTTTPEPATFALMGAGLLALAGVTRARRTQV